MTKPKALPLYPKISSIYNKILQLTIAIALLVLLINLLLLNQEQQTLVVEQHFEKTARVLVNQAKPSIELLIKQKDIAGLDAYLKSLVENAVIKGVYVYSATGQIISATDEQSINDLYGISQQQANFSVDFLPFIIYLGEHGQLGYVRVTLQKSALTKSLEESQNNNQELLRIMLLIAGVIGFLLTRGFNRFSRQGFRPNQKLKIDS